MTDINDLPREITLAVPRTFRDYVVRRQNPRLLVIALAYFVIVVLLPLALGGKPHFDYHAIVLLAGVFTWLVQLKKTWQYAVDEGRFSLIRPEPKYGEMLWHDLQWRQDVILNVQEDEWRGLPALRVHAKLKGHKTPQDLWMVYAHEDAGTVQSVVLPLIEQYRQQYRHPLWANTLRQENKL